MSLCMECAYEFVWGVCANHGDGGGVGISRSLECRNLRLLVSRRPHQFPLPRNRPMYQRY